MRRLASPLMQVRNPLWEAGTPVHAFMPAGRSIGIGKIAQGTTVTIQ
jgi:hypothetical protein